MKRFAGLLVVSILAGAITLGSYILFIEKPNYAIVAQDKAAETFETSYTPTSPRGSGLNDVDFTLAAENTVNAVVHVKNVTMGTNGPSSVFDFFYGSQPKYIPQVGTGSGVIISPDGYIITNHHVIKDAKQLQVTLNNNKTYDGEVVGSDPGSDIALIKVNADEKLPYLAFGDSDHVKVGEWVLAVGNPFNLTSTVTAGIVSAKARDLGRNNQSFIQTDAAVNPGNSGGALVNTNGDLVGINTAITSQTGSYVGYSFAVPSNIAKKVVDDLLEFGNVQRGLLGISAVNINSRQAIENGINEVDGVYIGGVEEDMGAERAGLREGDVIKKVDQIRVRKFADLTGYLASKRPGDMVEVTIDRDNDLKTLSVKLMKRQTLALHKLGFEVKNLSAQDKKRFKTQKGVKIVSVPEVRKEYGVDGKIILSINGEDIDDIQEARKLSESFLSYSRSTMTLLNEKGEREKYFLD